MKRARKLFSARSWPQSEDAAETTAGFYCCWKMMVEDRWLKHCDSFPKWQFRLLRRGRADSVDFGHGQKEGRIDGILDYVREPYLHFPLSKGWTFWLERHNRYASEEAVARLNAPVQWKQILARGSFRSGIRRSNRWSAEFPAGRFCVFSMLTFFRWASSKGAPASFTA